MEQKLPIVALTKEAFALPLGNLGRVFLSLGVLLLGGAIATLLAGIIGGFSGVDLVALSEALTAGNTDAIASAAGTILLMLLVFLAIVLFLAAHIFNYWVNVGAHGPESASFKFGDGRFKASLVNGLKFLMIFILIAIIQFVAQYVLSLLGLAPGLDQTAALTDGTVSEQHLKALTLTIVSTIIICLVYSLFSANLTMTALASDKEGLEHEKVMDFAIVLMLAYAAVLVPTTILAFLGIDLLVGIVQAVLGVFLMMVVPTAHGLRYRIAVSGSEDMHGAMQPKPMASMPVDTGDIPPAEEPASNTDQP